MEDIRNHEHQVAHDLRVEKIKKKGKELQSVIITIITIVYTYLMRVALSPNDILEKLIPPGSQDVQNGYRDYSERLPAGHGILVVRQSDDPEGGYQLGDGEEELMVPLGVKLVVPVIDVDPPSVIVGEHSGRKEQHHGVSESLLNRQPR